MKKIQPYLSVAEALKSLDNGGRFFNFFTHEDDGKIADAELEKVAGLYGDKQKAMLYLDMAISKLAPSDQEQIISKLDEAAAKTYQKYKAIRVSPAEAKAGATKNQSLILTGTPVHLDMKSELSGFILIPVMVGSVMTLIPVPIMDQYDIYEIRNSVSEEKFLIAHDKTKDKIPEQLMHVGGVVKVFHLGKDQKDERLFLDVSFFENVEH